MDFQVIAQKACLYRDATLVVSICHDWMQPIFGAQPKQLRRSCLTRAKILEIKRL